MTGTAEGTTSAHEASPLSKLERKLIEQALDYFYDYHTDDVCAILFKEDPQAHYRLLIK